MSARARNHPLSTWLVSKHHIDYLISAGIEYGVIKESRACELGYLLQTINAISVRSHFGVAELKLQPLLPRYTLAPLGAPVDPVWVLAAVECYVYQSCHADTWESNESRLVMIRLADAAIGRMPVSMQKPIPRQFNFAEKEFAVFQSNEYANAPWGIGPEEWQQAKRRVATGR